MPVAFIQQRKYGLVWKSYILNEYIDGTMLSEYVKQPVSEQENAEAISATDQLLKELARNKITHGDVKANNFIIQNGRPAMIDLDSMRRHRIPFLLKLYSERMIETFHRRLK